MANLNKVMLMGNITRDPELKYLPSQTAVCEFGLAINRTWTSQDGARKEETTFVDCSAFGKPAETIVKYMKKGSPIFVEGRLKLDQWEAQDGSKRSKMRVVVENFQFISSRPQGQGGEGGEGGYAAPAPASRPPARTAGRPGGYQQRPAAQDQGMADPPAPDDMGPPSAGEEPPF
jgi:single-strand DNA-binding protein